MIPINEIFGIAALTLGVLGCLLNNRKAQDMFCCLVDIKYSEWDCSLSSGCLEFGNT